MYTVYMTRKWKQYIGNPSERIRFEKTPRVHYNRNGGFYERNVWKNYNEKEKRRVKKSFVPIICNFCLAVRQSVNA